MPKNTADWGFTGQTRRPDYWQLLPSLRCSFDCRLWLFCLGPFCLPVCHEQRGEVGRSYNERLACLPGTAANIRSEGP
ncbi:hypothetical protein pipiens_005615 [Culex pipiens pipiens]|uniref:Uncharacterized protein n=1 Tax=Culex pipiens pipiens TaxID=38569 RepID=A0ABD1DV61_CULPP